MSKSSLVTSPAELEARLQGEVLNARGRAAIIAGHCALVGSEAPEPDIAPDGCFGAFPAYTLDLGARLVSHARREGKEAKLVLIVDDHSQQCNPQWYIDTEENAVTARAIGKYVSEFMLPEEYRAILAANSCTLEDFAQSSQGICFQESRYRREFMRETGLPPGCAGETRLILEELAQKGYGSVIGMIPERCRVPTCQATSFYRQNPGNPGLFVTFAYLPTGNALHTPESLWSAAKEHAGGVRLVSFEPRAKA